MVILLLLIDADKITIGFLVVAMFIKKVHNLQAPSV